MSNPTQVSVSSTKGQLAPYRLYACMIHCAIPGTRRIDEHRIALKTGEVAAHFKCRHSRIHEWISTLVAVGLIEVEAKEYGRRYIYIVPPNLSKKKR